MTETLMGSVTCQPPTARAHHATELRRRDAATGWIGSLGPVVAVELDGGQGAHSLSCNRRCRSRPLDAPEHHSGHCPAASAVNSSTHCNQRTPTCVQRGVADSADLDT